MAQTKSNPTNGVKKPKRTRKRKARTEVSSSSSSSESEAEKQAKSTKKKVIEPRKSQPITQRNPSEPALDNADISDESVGDKSPSPVRPQEEFGSMYLRRVTNELADDLDQVRQAKDFNERSLPMLIHALKQGESIFSAEEKRRIQGV